VEKVKEEKHGALYRTQRRGEQGVSQHVVNQQKHVDPLYNEKL